MISVVIPNYNSADLLKKNLPRLLELLKKSKLEHEVIVADDASTDDSLKVLADFPVRTVTSNKNTGFAGNVDRGIRQARGEVVFTLKTDSIPAEADYFKLLLKHFDDPKVFAVSSALKTTEDGKEEIRGCGEIYFQKGFFLHRRGPSTQLGTSLHSAWADGGASAFKRDLYRKIGGFDSLYNPFYWEDTDLGYRAWKAGYEVHFEPKASLLHNYESGAIARHYDQRQVKTISQRNQFIFTWKNADLKHLLLYFLWEPYHFAVALKNRDGNWFKAYWQASAKFLIIMRQRLWQKMVTKLSDDLALSRLST